MRLFRELPSISREFAYTQDVILNSHFMTPHIIFHIADFDNERDMIMEIVGRNLDKKLDSYLKKLTKNDDEIRVEATLTRDVKK